MAGERTLFADLVGTGLSAQIFAGTSGFPLGTSLVNDLCEGAYAASESARLRVPPAAVTQRLARRPVANADLIEVVDYDTCGALRAIRQVGNVIIANRDASDLHKAVFHRVAAMHTASDAYPAAMDRNGIDRAKDLGSLQRTAVGLLDRLHAHDLGPMMHCHRLIKAFAMSTQI